MASRPPSAGILAALLVPAFGLLGFSGCSRAQHERAVVVLVTCDTLRADRLGFHGWPRSTSPRLDALARESLVYESAWSTAPITGPALSALMTGLCPEDLGLQSNKTLLAAGANTLAERLSAMGVDTAAVVSNWVLRRRPELPDAGLQQGFELFDDTMLASEPARPSMKERLATDTTDRALAWLDEREDAGAFFLWVHYQDPHGPYTPPAAYLVPPEAQEFGEPELQLGQDQTGRRALPRYQAIDDERRPAVYRSRYEGEIRYFDEELGRLLEGLRERGVLERALLIFSADHGESLGEHQYYFSHGQNLFRELLHVPLLIRPPGGAPAPARVEQPVSHLDLYPTVLAHFGLEPGPTRGIDLLAGAPPAQRVLPSGLRRSWSITRGNHRLIVEPGRARLFDLGSDPHELRDLSRAEPGLVRSLTRARNDFFERLPVSPLSPARPTLSADDLQILYDLGYSGEDQEH